jgi:hypothetical protein
MEILMAHWSSGSRQDRRGEPTGRARFYEALGVTATYEASARTAQLEIELPRSAKSVSEGRHKP